jgi:hypothetical protein
MNVRQLVVGLAVAAALVGAVAGCSGGGGSGSVGAGTAASSTAAAGALRIDMLDVPDSVPCNGTTSATVPVQYATSAATRVRLYVDGREIPHVKIDDSVQVPVHCDPVPHTVVVIAYDAGKGKTSQQKNVVSSG